jgi:hypothetical protein
VAANIGRAAFFAPEQEIDPESFLPPTIFNFSMIMLSQMEILYLDSEHAVHLFESALSKGLKPTYVFEEMINPQIVCLQSRLLNCNLLHQKISQLQEVLI